MNINNDYYQQITNDFPEYVTKEQFYKIAHISKKTAQYLLQSKKIPCMESGKKTRKYKIKVSDIIDYLIDRELRSLYYTPKSSKHQDNISLISYLYVRVSSFSQEDYIGLNNYFTNMLIELNDILTVKEISCFFGLADEIISRNCTKGKIQSFLIGGKRMIPKICLIEFLSSSYSMCLIGKSMIYDSFIADYVSQLSHK